MPLFNLHLYSTYNCKLLLKTSIFFALPNLSNHSILCLLPGVVIKGNTEVKNYNLLLTTLFSSQSSHKSSDYSHVY